MRHTLLVALTILSATVFAGSRHHWYGSSCGTCVTPIADDVASCDDLQVILNDREAVRAEETVPVSAARSLTVRAPDAGGIYVHRTDAPRFSVKACKAGEVGASLSEIRVNVDGDRVSASGPSTGNWVVYFIVDMPRGAKADFGTTNGPIEIRGVDATINAHAENGPVSARDTIGSIRLTAVNGPVAFTGSSGDVVLRTDNGPIAVNLTDYLWSHGTLDARSDNGPLALHLPRAYHSGVTVDTDGHSPVTCHAQGCREHAKFASDDDGGRWPNHIELGSGATAVTLATNNGPVSINER